MICYSTLINTQLACMGMIPIDLSTSFLVFWGCEIKDFKSFSAQKNEGSESRRMVGVTFPQFVYSYFHKKEKTLLVGGVVQSVNVPVRNTSIDMRHETWLNNITTTSSSFQQREM